MLLACVTTTRASLPPSPPPQPTSPAPPVPPAPPCTVEMLKLRPAGDKSWPVSCSNTTLGTAGEELDLSGAHLSYGDFEGATFTGAGAVKLNEAGLAHANLMGSELTAGLRFGKALIDFTEANLTNADLSGSKLTAHGSYYAPSTIDFTEAILAKADLSGSKLSADIIIGLAPPQPSAPSPPSPSPPLPSPSPPMPVTVYFTAYGPCTVSGTCVRSPNYPSEYAGGQSCTITPESPAVGLLLSATAFNTESGYDKLIVNGVAYSGTTGPSHVLLGSAFTWSSDITSHHTGWEVCAQAAPPSQPPSPPTPPASPPMPPGYLQIAGGYYIIESGSCGGALISTKSECDAAATALELSDKSASDYTSSSSSYDPPGCQLAYSSLYVYGGDSSGSCTSSKKCICMFTPPSPPTPPPLPPSPPTPPSSPPMPPGYLQIAGGYYMIESGSCGGALI